MAALESSAVPREGIVSFENLVKECQVELIEHAKCTVQQLTRRDSSQMVDGYGATAERALVYE